MATKWFKSTPILPLHDQSNVDREAGIISNVILSQVGEAKGHGVHLDQSFIEEIAKQGNEYKNGLRSRFGHPSMSNSTMGKQLGYFRNFRVEGDKAVADLHLLDAASKSPEGDLKEWVLSMAEEAPDSVMNSIVFIVGDEYQTNEAGELIFENFDEEKPVFVELSKLLFSDLVEQGAATETLYGERFNKDSFAVIATRFLNENPEIETFLKDNPAKLYGFFKNRGIDIEKTSWFAKLQHLFSTEKPWQAEIERLQLDSQQQIELLELKTENIHQLTETIASQITELNEKNELIERLDAEIEELKKQPVAIDASTFAAKTKKEQQEKSYEKINREMAEKRASLIK